MPDPNKSEDIKEPQLKDDPSTPSATTTPKRNNSLASTILPQYNETQTAAPPSYKTVTNSRQPPQTTGAGPSARHQPTNPASQSHTASCGNPASTVMAVMGDPNPSASEPPQAKRKFTDRLRDIWGDDLWGTKPGSSSFHLSRERGEAGAGTTSGHWNVQGVRLSDYGGFGRSGRKKK
ncbi:hypothetical protein KC343_g2181 [Hortaea werneckii]|nr:hypothetical protein KC352_g12929 [Hortaea werneckii]KAI7621152.1 hypothetical protein KC346_g3772 [Hortaea werneckii]KAI7634828.1 hypothetical protein KC343_g2181 [Hortaea werneckii]KAI7676986.1 hypothetical protein KC319_g4157 [Hortaea werneckii]KAI7708602.1 hypothetical protein KC322_g4991 [Hortaea werneckii]